MVNLYFKLLDKYMKIRKGKGYSQSDFKNAQEDVAKYLKKNAKP